MAFRLCVTCKQLLNRGKLPTLSKTNGFLYPYAPKVSWLPPLHPASERLPFIHIRRLRHGIVGQVVNVPVDVSCMGQCLLRHLSDDYAFKANIKRNLIHKSVYLGEYFRKRVIRQWLNYLVKSTLYKLYDIKIDMSALDQNEPIASTSTAGDDEAVAERIDTKHMDMERAPESEVLAARQHRKGTFSIDCTTRTSTATFTSAWNG
jgi:hypothetical protein